MPIESIEQDLKENPDHLREEKIDPILYKHGMQTFRFEQLPSGKKDELDTHAMSKLLHEHDEVMSPGMGVLVAWGDTRVPIAKTFPNKREEQESLRQSVFTTETHDEVLKIMEEHELDQHVEDYHSYLKYRQEDLDEEQSRGIILQSLQSWAWFLLDDEVRSSRIPYPNITADYFGSIDLIWRLSPEQRPGDFDSQYYGEGKGVIILRFLPSYLNYLSVLSGAFEDGKRRIAFDGYFSYKKTLPVLFAFQERIVYAEDRLEFS